MTILKNTILLLSAFVTIMATAYQGSATHIVGGDLTYNCLGNDLYEVTLTVRRDCFNGADDAQFDNPASLGIFDKFGSLQVHLGLQGRALMPIISQRTITNNLEEDCRIPPNDAVCVEEATYRDTIRLPYNKLGYVIGYQRCCRNTILNNIVNPLETGGTYYSNILLEALVQCNSQPVIQDWANVFICAGEDFTFDHMAVDPDGDELVYKLCTPTAGASIDNPFPFVPSAPPYATVNWVQGFSATNAFGPTGNISIDPNTGFTSGRADLVGTYLIGICIEEYRDGVLLSTVRRDFEYNVLACVDPIIVDCEIRDNDCDGDNTISFINRTIGADSYKWFFDYPNDDPAFMSTIPSPTFTYPTAGKYTVRKEASRDSDGCTVVEEFIVSTTRNFLEADFSAEFLSCQTGRNLISLTDLSIDPTGTTCAIAWEWIVNINGSEQIFNGNPATFDASNASSATITLNVTNSSGCESTITKTINLDDIFTTSTIVPTLLSCTPNGFEVQLENRSSSNVATITSTVWTVTNNGTTSDFTGNSITLNTSGGPITVSTITTFSNGCVTTATQVLNPSDYIPTVTIVNNADGSGPGTPPISTDCGVTPVDVLFSALISGNISGLPVSYNWTDDNGNSYTSEQITIALISGQQLVLDLEVTYDNGCTLSANDYVFIGDFGGNIDLIIDTDVNCSVSPPIVTLTDNTVTSSTVSSSTWTVNGVASSGNSVTFQNDNSEVNYVVNYTNGCVSTFNNTYSNENLIPQADFSAGAIECDGNIITVQFTDTTIGSGYTQEWIIDGQTFTSSPFSLDFDINETVTVSYSVTSQFGCVTNITQTLSISDLAQGGDGTGNGSGTTFDINILSCDNSGFTYILTNTSANINASTWTIDDQNGSTAYTGSPIEVLITSDIFTVTLENTTNNGCGSATTQSFNSNQLLPTLNILNNLPNGCLNANGETITLSPGLSSNNLGTPTYSWTYSIDGGMSVTSTQNPSFVVLPGQQVNSTLTATFSNGCTVQANDGFTVTNMGVGGDVAITDNLNGPCVGQNGESVTFFANTTNPVSSYLWNCNIAGQTSTSTDQSVAFTIVPGQTADCTVTVTFADGCTNTERRVFTAQGEILLDIAEDINCDNLDETIVTLSDVTNVTGANVTDYNWTINGISFGGNLSTISFPVSTMTGAQSVSLTAMLSNGCIATYNNTFSPEDFQPTLDYDVTLGDCLEGQGEFTFEFTGNIPDCLDIESLTWTINGMMFTGNPVVVTLPLDMEVMVAIDVTFTNGNTFGGSMNLPDFDPNTLVNNITVGILDTIPGNDCGDEINLEVEDPGMSGNYTWSSNSDFTDILGTGTTLQTTSGALDSNMMVFVQLTDDANCTYGTGSIAVMNNAIVLGIDSMYVICPGDTTSLYCINSVNSLQEITYDWKGADQLISGGNTNCPTIGIPESQTEDFSLILCTTNQFGCTSVDTIDFIISTPMDLEPFTFMTDSCGSLTINFMSSENFSGDGAMWDFGDGIGTSAELNPTYTYSEPGTYTVSLDSEFGVCVNGGVSQNITVPLIPTIAIPMAINDTISYESGNPVSVDAMTTNADGAIISWCNLDGTPFTINGETVTGTPIEIIPEQDTLTLIAKVSANGCEDVSTTVTLIRTSSFPEITICSNPENATVCIGDTFSLFVKLENFMGEPDDFEYFWSQEECIISGQGTDRITATTEISKSFNLTLTNTNDNMDTTLTFMVTVEDPTVIIMPDNGIPGQEEMPQVCQGSSINLDAGNDPNCDYSWSTGETDTNIDVEPMENTTYSVTCVTSNGCEAFSSIDIEVTPPQCNADDVFIPSAFSPNQDNINDRLYVRSKFIREMEFFVTNRWGQEVWRTTNQDDGWDGTFNGETLAPDVYAYCIKVTCVNDATYTSSGNVSILK